MRFMNYYGNYSFCMCNHDMMTAAYFSSAVIKFIVTLTKVRLIHTNVLTSLQRTNNHALSNNSFLLPG